MAVLLELEVVAREVSPKLTLVKKPLLLVFCKNPRLGKVKTRLAVSIGAEKALCVYKALLTKTAQVLSQLTLDIHLYYSEEIVTNDCFSDIVTEKKLQKGDDLGQRMANAFQEGFQSYDAIVIIGTDLWTLEQGDIINAFSALEKNQTVIGPSSDGGYYLLGLADFIPHLFEDKDWGSATVLGQTLENLNQNDVQLLTIKNDVDTYSDLEQNPTLKAII